MSSAPKFHTDTQFESFSTTHQAVVKNHSERQQIYKQSFADFPDRHIYRDPLGFRAGEPVVFQKEWSQKLYDEPIDFSDTAVGTDEATIVEKWDELQNKGFSVKQTTDIIQKALGTGDWQLPLDILEDTFVVSPGKTPMAEVIPRVTTQDDTIHATAETDQPDPQFDLEANVSTDSDGNAVYDYDDPAYEDLEYEVLGYGVATRYSDKLVLSSSNLRPTQSTIESSLLTGHRKTTERQILWGTDDTSPGDGDANGWAGFTQMGSTDADSIAAGDIENSDTLKATIEQGIDIVGENANDISSLGVVLGFDVHRTLRRAYEDRQRYEPAEELDVGFVDLAMEGGQVPVFRSTAIPRIGNYPASSTEDFGFVVNLESVALYQLSEPTLDPLANLGPEERVGAAQYNVLVSEAGDGNVRNSEHIQRLQVDTA